MKRDAATERQVRAADPQRSTWLAANAGSGKTRVLTDRVARLLLSGVPPEQILCLTYTKAAASEMQNRLFKRLGEWSMKEDGDLRATLAALGEDAGLDPETLRRARSLFASAIETPGGLKVQTIHAFCAAVLRRFPLEAGVSPQFQEMEDRAGDLLRAQIVQEMAEGPEAGLLRDLATQMSDGDFDAITKAIAGARDRFDPSLTDADLLTLFELPQDHGPDWIWGDVFGPGDRELLRRLAAEANAQSATMVKLSEDITSFGFDRPAPELGPFLAGKLLTKALEPSKSVPTRKLWDTLSDIEPVLRALIERLAEAAKRPFLVSAFRKACVLHAFARAFLPRFAAAKAARGWLDFDDLIYRTRDLLSDPAVAAWVLYRLDGRIDHILVDEAQDTSPVQWQVIELLAQEFTSGDGARSNTQRTIFVVGDKKQSIYSFQGADPSGFDRMRTGFATKLNDLGQELQDTELLHSFRSSEAILKLVDEIFVGREASGFPRGVAHIAFKEDMAGRVDLWPVIDPTPKPEDRHWTDTVDHVDETHHTVQLAQSIAAQIGQLLDGQDLLPVWDPEQNAWAGRRIEPRDILILVQRRSELFAEIIRACKKAQLPIAGADVLKVGAEIAVRDLAALLSWLALPEDDLSLAVVLKSPLFGWDEQALFTLCHGREEPFLWRRLEAQKDAHPEDWAILSDLRDSADFLRPYDLIERILIRHKGRARLLSRLGPEAEDGINALLDQAIAYETTETPSLTGFLLWMQTDDLSIKRQPDAASNQIRVMTVHGAKGLEAPIVILPDCIRAKRGIRDTILPEPRTPLWKPASSDLPPLMQPWVEAEVERQRQERDRLLYVALTRAENWLIIAAAGATKADKDNWHDQVRAAMGHLNAQPRDFGIPGDGLRFETGRWPTAISGRDEMDAAALPPAVPVWLANNAEPPPAIAPVLLPSKLGGAKALPGEAGQDEETAKAYGTLVHRWLEILAESAQPPAPPDDAEARRAFDEAAVILAAPHLRRLFAPGSMAEVTLSAPVAALAGARMRGTIDRLILSETDVFAVDFKTNATVPERPEAAPEGLLRQMGAYAHMLAALYPDRKVRTGLLWTKTATLMELPHDLVTEALRRAT